MATPNYSYEKRQRELAKKRKAEEKRQKKLHSKPGETSGEAGPAEPAESPGETPTPPAG